MHIRLAAPSDVPFLELLITESVRGLSQGYYSPQQVESALAHMFGVDTQLLVDGTYYVVEDSGQIVGCGGWSRRKTLFGGDRYKIEADAPLDPAQDAARLRAFFVHPKRARQGIGRRLLHVCEQAARAEGFQTLTLVATAPGEPLYTALGFTVTERFDIPLADGVLLPAARMRKIL